MKHIVLLSLLLGSLGSLAQTQVPISTFSSGGGSTGSLYPTPLNPDPSSNTFNQPYIPSNFGSIGQPMVFPRTVITSQGAGVMNAVNLMFATSVTAAPLPANQPTALNFTNVTSTQLMLSMTAATGSPAAAGYLVLRKVGSAINANPSVGVIYTAGSTLDDAIVVASGISTSGLQSSLVPGTNYFYKIFSYNNVGGSINYLITTPLVGNVFTEPAVPTSLVFSAVTATSLTASFTASAGAAGYLAIRKASSSPTGVPTDAVGYTVGDPIGDGQVAFVGTGTNFTDAGLTGGAAYFYDIYAYSGATAYQYATSVSPLEGSASTLSAAPTAQPTALVFSNQQPTQLTLTWTAASPSVTGYIVLRRVDGDPTAVPVVATTYTAGSVLGDAVIVYAGTGTTFTDVSLLGETNYFYQVIAYNGAGVTLNYLTASPLTGMKSTLGVQPSIQTFGISFSNVTASSLKINLQIPPTASGSLVIRRQGSAPTGVPVDGTTYTVGDALGNGTVVFVGNSNQIDETGLSPGTAYHYSFFSYSGAGGSSNFLTTNPTQASQTTLTLDNSAPTISLTNTAASVASGASLLVKATVTENESSLASVSLDYRSIAGSSSFTTTSMTLVGASWEFSIPAAQIGELGIEYKVTATNSVGLSNNASGVTTKSFESSELLPFTSFGTDVSNYRIISVPALLKSKTVFDVIADDFGGTLDKTKWRMYRYEGGSTNELNLTSTIDLGKGYWLIAKDQKPIDIGEGTTTSVTSTTPFKMDLVSGWNQIGNPYPFNVSWADVLSASGNPSTITKYKTYEGTFNESATVVKKFEGGFVFSNGTTQLTFPVAKNAAVNGRTAEEPQPERLKNSIDQGDWEIILDLSNATRINRGGGFGMHRDANAEFDPYDDFTLPRFLDYVELNHTKSLFGSNFSKDVVPTEQNHTWEFTVESNLEGTSFMTWDNSYFGDNDKHLVLWDVEAKRPVNMKEANRYSFKGNITKTFQVFFGSKEYVQEKMMLKSLIIHNISPNPTDGEAVISFSLPGTDVSFVQVRVLNLLGQSVSAVFEGNLEAGYNEVTWSGKDNLGNRAVQGVYLVEVVQGKDRESKRLIVK